MATMKPTYEELRDGLRDLLHHVDRLPLPHRMQDPELYRRCRQLLRACDATDTEE